MAVRTVEDVPATPVPENKVFYPALDGFRALAAFAVFFFHYFSGDRFPGILHFGWVGVNMFFVLSGFLITGILYDTRNSERRLSVFYARRSLRVFPLYYGVFALLVLTTPIFRWEWHRAMVFWPLYLGNYLGNLIHVNGTAGLLFSPVLGNYLDLNHFWSLAVEEQFYLVWPFVVYGVRDRVRLRNLCLIIVGAVPLIRFLVYMLTSPTSRTWNLFFFATPFRFDGLVLGGALALALRGPEGNKLHENAKALFVGAVCILLGTWVFAVLVLHQPAGMHSPAPWVQTFGLSLFDLTSAAAVLLTLRAGNPVHAICSVKPLRLMGKVSYGFYVLHAIPYVFYVAAGEDICGARFHSFHAFVGGGLAFVCTSILAYLSYRFYETPFLRLKDHFKVR